MRYKTFFGIWIILGFLCNTCSSRRQFKAETGDDAVTLHVLQNACIKLLNDVQKTVSEEFILRGKGLQDSILEYQKDTSQLKKGILTLQYLNISYKGHRVSGQLEIKQYGALKWKERNAKLLISCNALHVQHEASGLQMDLNGTLELSNISGGTWFEVEYLNLADMRYTVKSNAFNWKLGGEAIQNLNINMLVKRNFNLQYISGMAETENMSNVQFWGKLPTGIDFYQATLIEPVYQLHCNANNWVLGKTEIKRSNCDYSLITQYETNTSCASTYVIQWSRKQQSHAISKNL